jgi:hypothetical protein
MIAIIVLFVRLLCDCFKSRRRLEAEILVLRHQLKILHRLASRRRYMTCAGRALFVRLYRADTVGAKATHLDPSFRTNRAT